MGGGGEIVCRTIFIFQLHNQTTSCSRWESTEGTTVFEHMSEEVEGSAGRHQDQTVSWQAVAARGGVSQCEGCGSVCPLSSTMTDASWTRPTTLCFFFLVCLSFAIFSWFPLSYKFGLLVRLQLNYNVIIILTIILAKNQFIYKISEHDEIFEL